MWLVTRGRITRSITALWMFVASAGIVACGTEDPPPAAPPGGRDARANPGGDDGGDPTADGDVTGRDIGPVVGPDGGPITGDTGPNVSPPDAGPTGPTPQNPNNHRIDSDCDGLSDAYEFSTVYPGGAKTAVDVADTDMDGLADGLELGVTAIVAGSGCANVALDVDPASTTSPVRADTDGDQIPDGIEDLDHNGAVGPGERDPNRVDTDGDGLPDGLEDANWNGRTDAGELDPTNRDSDSDGIGDGVEDANHDGTRQPDETDPLDDDSDADGVLDGDEDTNHDGVRQSYEIDPRTPDTDCDGLTDGEELTTFGTSPLRADSDNDGILDGVELGRTMPVANSNCPGFVGDAEPGTMTNPTDADSDNDGLPDGFEDANQDGRWDTNETNPNNVDTDGDGFADGDEVLIGADPLDPMSPNAQQGQGIQAICADRNLQPTTFHAGTGGDWTIALDPAVTYTAIGTTSMDTEVAAWDDVPAGMAGFIVEMPQIGGANPTSAAQDSAYNSRLSTGAAGASLGISVRQSARNIVSHDGHETAVSAVLEVTTPGAVNASGLRNTLLRITTGLSAGSFTGLPTTTGPSRTAWVVTYQILVRPGGQLIVALGALDGAAFDNPGDVRSLRLGDLTNGTAIAERNATRGKGCDPFDAQGDSVADFIWMADVSGSTDDDRGRIISAAQQVFDALANNNVDFRMAVVPHSQSPFHRPTNAGNTRGGFTNNRMRFVNELADTGGNDGCEFGLGAVDAAIARSLPRTAIGAQPNNQKLRGEATLAVIYVSDEHAQEVEEGPCFNVPQSINCPTNIGDVWGAGGDVGVCNRAPNNAQQACVDRIVAPYIARIQGEQGIAFGQVFAATPLRNCNSGHFRCVGSAQDRNEAGRGYIEVINATGGLFYSPCDANPGAGPLTAIVDAVAGAASQFQLSGAPIASSIKVGLTRPNQMPQVVPRHKQDGFDYDPVSNSIFFRGQTYRPEANDRVTVSYRVWSPPDDPCGPCDTGQLCDPMLGVCTCDQATCNANCGPNEVCDDDCNCACAPDCGGNCGANEVCNANTCACECPSDCGGCPAGTVCDPTSCACECDTDCGGACAGTNLDCNQASCNCQCPSDCGGTCTGAASVCNQSTCACDCDPNCTDACVGSRSICDPANACACVCPSDCGGCPDGTLCDGAACECVCPTGCNDGCPANQVCDPSNECQCVCPADCGGCDADEYCDTTTCACIGGI